MTDIVSDWNRGDSYERIASDYAVDPSLARLRRNTGHPPLFIKNPEPGGVLVVAGNSNQIDQGLYNEMMKGTPHALTYLIKTPDYAHGVEKQAAAEYVIREIVLMKPRALMAVGNEALPFLTRPATEKERPPPVSVCHARRFSTPRGVPVIAALPFTQAFHRRFLGKAVDALSYTLNHLDGEFA